MDLATQIRLTREMVDIDSTTGREGDGCQYVAALLRTLGYHVTEQPVTDGRFNVIATLGTRPVVVLSTHLDCVPPFFPSREEGGRIHGRGACDAKGIAIAQIAASERLRASGETRAGLLFVVGEERGSDGAKLANTIAPGSRFLVNGEPTGNRLGRATRGLYRLRLHAEGRAAHSSRPDLGESAIEKLVDAIVALRDVAWPADELFGQTSYTVGMIHGGVAPNVIPASATAELLFRLVGPADDVRSRLTSAVGRRVLLEDVHVVPPVRLTTAPDFDSDVFPFTTDVPFLDAWGAPLLFGPGSIDLAHTADEHIAIADLDRAVGAYERLVRHLLR